jgi:hypothetical protein
MPYSNVQGTANTHEENLQVTSLEDLTEYLKSNSLTANTHEENLQVTSLEDLTEYLKSNSLTANRKEEHDCQCQSNQDASKFL